MASEAELVMTTDSKELEGEGLGKNIKKLKKKAKKKTTKATKVVAKTSAKAAKAVGKAVSSATKVSTQAIQNGLKKSFDKYKGVLKAELEFAKATAKVGKKIGGKVIRKVLPNGSKSAGAFLQKHVRIAGKTLQTSGTVVSVVGDMMVVAGEVTGQPELVAAGTAVDNAGNAMVVGGQVLEEAAVGIKYAIKGDTKAAMIAFMKAAQTGLIGYANTLTGGTFDNFLAAAIAASQGDYAGATTELGKAALDAVAAETPGTSSAQLAAQYGGVNTPDTSANLRGYGIADGSLPGYKEKRPIYAGMLEDGFFMEFDRTNERGGDPRLLSSLNRLRSEMQEESFARIKLVPIATKRPAQDSAGTEYGFDDVDQPAKRVKRENRRAEYVSPHNRAIERKNIVRGYTASFTLEQRHSLINGIDSRGTLKKYGQKVTGVARPISHRDEEDFRMDRIPKERAARKEDLQITAQSVQKTVTFVRKPVLVISPE